MAAKKIIVTIDEELLLWLQNEAKKNERSVNREIVKIIKDKKENDNTGR